MMAQYTVTIAGVYNIEVLINGKEIYGSPYKVLAIPGAIEAYQCTAEGEGVQQNTVVDTAVFFTIQARDVFANVITIG